MYVGACVSNLRCVLKHSLSLLLDRISFSANASLRMVFLYYKACFDMLKQPGLAPRPVIYVFQTQGDRFQECDVRLRMLSFRYASQYFQDMLDLRIWICYERCIDVVYEFDSIFR